MKQQDSNRRTIRSRESPTAHGTRRPALYRYGDRESFVLGPPFKLHTIYTSLSLSCIHWATSCQARGRRVTL